MAVADAEIKPSISSLWRNSRIRRRLERVRVSLFLLLSTLAGMTGCRVLSSGLPNQDGGTTGPGRDVGQDQAYAGLGSDQPAIDAGEPPGLLGPPAVVGCADGTREGFRDFTVWQDIAGCSGGFSIAGVVGSAGQVPACARQAGDTSANPAGADCSAADLCAAGWHLCQDGSDVAAHSPSGGCEGCVPGDEPRFFLVASGASPMGICSNDPGARNDLHGCGSRGEPESPDCWPLTRRMGFADCLATDGIWVCGSADESLAEAAVVNKTGPTLGGVLCCRDL